jgi:hypothetical protein
MASQSLEGVDNPAAALLKRYDELNAMADVYYAYEPLYKYVVSF